VRDITILLLRSPNIEKQWIVSQIVFMICTTIVKGQAVTFDLTRPTDLSIPITEHDPANAFFLPDATFTPFRAGDFVGSIEEGGPVRCDVVTLAPHGNGTHTECVGHILGKGYSLLVSLTQPIVTSRLVSVPLEPTNTVTRQALLDAWSTFGEEALIIRTLPNSADKRSRRWSGNNPPYIEPDAMEVIVERGVQHVLVDLPSVDPEEDAGALIAHHIFWQAPQAPRVNCTITELIYVPDELPDGRYALMFNAAAFDGDAAPSRPMVFPEIY
jgi:kynurenine formamidase